MTHSCTSIGRPQFLGIAALLLICWLSLSSASYAQNIRYVQEGASGNGLAPGTPSGNLQDMINDVLSGTVLVGAGLYTPTEGGDLDIRSTSFIIYPGVEVYGGYSDDFSSRTPTSSPSSSTLSGFILAPADGRILPPNKNGLEEEVQVYHVVYFTSISSDDRTSPGKLDKSAADEVVDTRRLDGFVITGGNADGDIYSPDSRGGGILINGSGGHCQPTIANCTLINNSATRGGAMCNYGPYASSGSDANPHVLNCSFINNTATELGGAIYNDGTYSFEEDHGNASGDYTNCTFINNSVSGESAKGGAIYNDASEGGLSSPTIVNCSFSGNTALTGGAIYNLASPRSEARVADNKAAKGAAESQSGTSAPLIINSSFVSNSATGGESDQGGAIYGAGFGAVVSATLVNCIFRDNSADFGGAIYLARGATSFIVNSSFNENHATYESEVSVGSAIYLHEDTRCSLVNCIFWSDGDGEEAAAKLFGFDGDSYGITSNHSLFQAGATTDIDPSKFTPAETDQFISSFPFVSDTNLQLANPSSNTAAAAAINSGNDAAYVGSYPTTDLAGNARRIGQIDRGAFEYQAPPVSQTGCADIVIIPVINFAASGSLSCANPKVRLTASGTGSAFVVTGPNGYVFSNVYRYCDNHSVLAIDVNVPGQYILKVYHGQSLYSTHSVTVTGTACP